jgi:hypothetical protein
MVKYVYYIQRVQEEDVEGLIRVTRDQKLLLTVETEVNGDSKSTNEMKRVLSWLVRWVCRAGKKDFCSAFAALVGPVTKYVFLIVHYFNSFLPIAQQARQAVVLGRLSLSMCLWACFTCSSMFLCGISIFSPSQHD